MYRALPRSLLAGELATAVRQRGQDEALDAVKEVLRSPGSPLPPPVREAMEQGFRADFSSVRIHADAQAAASAQAVDALAYTVGNHVVLGAGQAPAVGRLLAHELAHVLQQGDSEAGDDLVIEHPETPAEREAAAAADALEAGRTPMIRPRIELVHGGREHEQRSYEGAAEYAHGNHAGQATARGAAGRRLHRMVKILEPPALYDSGSLRPLLDAIAKRIDKEMPGAIVKRGPLPFVHDRSRTYVFSSLDTLVEYMVSELEQPRLYKVYGGDGAGGQAEAARRQAPEMRAFGFASTSLKGVETHLGTEVGRSSGRNHTITKQDLEDVLAVLTVNALSADRVQTEVARHDFQNFGSRQSDDFCNYQVQIGGSDLYYKRKNTSFSAVIVDKRLLEFDHAALLERLKAMHRESFKSKQNVIITTDDEAGAAFIAQHGKE